MDLIRSWLAAIVTWVLTMWITAIVGEAGGDQAAFGSFTGRLLWLYVPLMLAYLLIAGAASALHTRPHRGRRTRHLIAVLTVPVVTVVLSTVLGAVGHAAPSGLISSLVAAALGTVAGWLLADLVWGYVARDRAAYF